MMPLFDNLKNYKSKDIYPFHMPGHKRQNLFDINPYDIDITEIDGFDNLHHAEGIILEAQNALAKTFGADRSYFLINGSTSGNIAATLYAGSGTVLCARNCHKSVFSGLILSGANPVYIMPEIIDGLGLCGSISPKKVLEAVRENPSAKALIITSPTAEGIVSDIKSISDILHEHNMLLIVDEAHGAHFGFDPYFPESAVHLGADIVIQSLHKTLPCLTQCSVLHASGKRVDIKRLESILAMVQSSSPSYVFMSAIDIMREHLDKNGKKAFTDLKNNLEDLRNYADGLKNIILIDKKDLNPDQVYDMDKSKLLFFIKSREFSGRDFKDALLNDHKIQLEMYLPHFALAISSIADTREGFARLKNALTDIDKKFSAENDFQISLPSITLPEAVISPREAFFGQKKSAEITDIFGRISADFVIPYPPGIPLIVPGEKFDRKIFDICKEYSRSGIDILGTDLTKAKESFFVLH